MIRGFETFIGGLFALAIVLGAPAQAQDRVAAATPRQVFVVNTQDASVSLVDIATMKEIRRIPVGARPYGIVVSRDGRRLAVGVEDEEKVKFYDTTDFKLLGETRIGKMFNDHIVLTPDGRYILVANFYSDDVVAIDAEKMKEAYRIKGASAPHVIKFGPLRKYAYVTCKKITGIAIVDPRSRRLVKFHQINVNPRSLTFAPDESKIYFGSFWVDGFFEMDPESGKITRLFAHDPPADKDAPQEVTYHGVETVIPGIVLAANEGRSYVDAVDVRSGKQLDRLFEGVSKPCCVERIPSPTGSPVRVLVSNIEDGTLQLVEVSPEGKLRSIAKARVGKAPKRVAFMPTSQ
jgi:YVTN family beta-propeller protein